VIRRADRVWAVIAGGGTAGHVLPAVAIGQALVRRGHSRQSIHFVGSSRGMEGRLVPDAGFSITLLPGRGIARRWTVDNLVAVGGLLAATLRALLLVGRLRPSVVIAVGGYASAAAALAAVVWRIPLVVAEQNAVPGLANRLAGRFAAACAVSFPGTPLPRAVVTGNPVRPEMLAVDRSDKGRARARAALGLPDDVLVVAAAGGSLGARRVNQAVLGLARAWAERPGLAIRHVVGERDFAELRQAAPAPTPGGLVYQQVGFENRMDLLLGAADVAIQRAGASTVAELTAVGVPAILVPLPGAPGDHQSANAHRLAEAGAAQVIADGDLDATRLAGELDALLADPGQRQAMAAAARGLARPHAAEAVAGLAEAHARDAQPDLGPLPGPGGDHPGGEEPGGDGSRGAGGEPGDRVGRSGRGDRSQGGGLDLRHPRRVHIVGIGGAGMSAIAGVLVAMGHHVSGTDTAGSERLRRLQAVGARIRVGHDAQALGDADVVAVSTAIPPDNPEVVEAGRRGLRVWRRAEVLAAICAERRTVAVAGTHGKTTTSAMLAAVLRASGRSPSYIVGGDLIGGGAGAAWDTSCEWLVVEADESDGTFLELPAEAVIVTSVEPDHLDFYGDEATLRAAFRTFVQRAGGPRVLCADDAGAMALVGAPAGEAAAMPGVLTYGTSEAANVHVEAVSLGRAGSRFSMRIHPMSGVSGEPSVTFGPFQVAVPGMHNLRNAAAAVTMAHALGVPWDEAGRGLGTYRGVARRFEPRGERDGVTFVDDYGHLPGEVAAVLATAAGGGWSRVIAVYQPHRYTRTASLWRQFSDAFCGADVLLVTDVYPAGESPQPGVTGRLIFDAVTAAHPADDVRYVASLDAAAAELQGILRPGDLCLTIGAGDVTTLPDRFVAPGRPPGE
jgi:UDP-N-acetylmuramate--alanine ligase